VPGSRMQYAVLEEIADRLPGCPPCCTATDKRTWWIGSMDIALEYDVPWSPRPRAGSPTCWPSRRGGASWPTAPCKVDALPGGQRPYTHRRAVAFVPLRDRLTLLDLPRRGTTGNCLRGPRARPPEIGVAEGIPAVVFARAAGPSFKGKMTSLRRLSRGVREQYPTARLAPGGAGGGLPVRPAGRVRADESRGIAGGQGMSSRPDRRVEHCPTCWRRGRRRAALL